jgi:hypothetical protein
MRPTVEDTTRLFAVVGAPYIPERHIEIDTMGRVVQPSGTDPDRSTGHVAISWLSGER